VGWVSPHNAGSSRQEWSLAGRSGDLVKKLKRSGVVLVVLLALIQAVRPAKTNPPIDETKTMKANATMSAEVAAIFERACNDCHSNKTTWPWYSQIAPVSWLLVDDVNSGRKGLSLSEWALTIQRKKPVSWRKCAKKLKEAECR
jgi:hypothetical protein